MYWVSHRQSVGTGSLTGQFMYHPLGLMPLLHTLCGPLLGKSLQSEGRARPSGTKPGVLEMLNYCLHLLYSYYK